MDGPLQGIRVLDLTRLLPGAYATLILADLGADVIKIEDPRGGDGMRRTAGGLFFDRLNRNKRSVTLDLRSPESRAVLDALLARADVIVDSFRPSTARRLGVDPAALQARHPRLVVASITGFGREGARAEVAAHDINYRALAGDLRPPDLPAPLIGDIGAAMTAAVRMLAALFARERTGAGSVVDAPIFEAARMWAMMPTKRDLPPERYGLFETRDGKWLALGALEEKFWAGFCERTGLAKTASADEVRAALRGKTSDEWQRVFDGADVCLTPVAPPDNAQPEPAAALGADTDDVLEAAGIDAATRARLRAGGVI
jgi:crotonobetainyl-CoA:carnitine CoA-transferase CaiB-like acyl-CoA transferase